MDSGVDFLILDEGEIILLMFVDVVKSGEIKGIFCVDGNKFDVIIIFIFRFDLLEMGFYEFMFV